MNNQLYSAASGKIVNQTTNKVIYTFVAVVNKNPDGNPRDLSFVGSHVVMTGFNDYSIWYVLSIPTDNHFDLCKCFCTKVLFKL